MVMAAIGYAMVQLRVIEHQRAALESETKRLRSDTEKYRSELQVLRGELAKSRAALASARAAINAFHSGRLDEAVALYDEALAADPDNAYLQNLRAYSLFRLGRINGALDGERRSVAADPTYAWGYFDLARFLCAASPPKMEEARAAAAEAIKLRPDLRLLMQSDGEFQRVCRHKIP
jgi:tetratricopeptide (TPR) repeat protein